LACLLVVVALGPPAAAADEARRSIVGGMRIGIAQAPWQVDVWSENGSAVSDCGGAILDASTILTAAHCVEGTTPGNPPTKGGLAVWAGTSSISAKTATSTDRLELQERRVTSARVHPNWRRRVEATGDLAVLRLAAPLELDGRRVASIPLAPALELPAAGPLLVAAELTVTGYGLTTGGAGGTTDGRLRRLPIEVVDPDECGDEDNAVELCAIAPSGSACSGDSGGPVVAPGPVLVGIVSNGPRTCPPGGANRYVNLAAPENRAFILGDDSPPAAPRRRTPARFAGPTDALRVGDSLTCDGGTFAGDEDRTTTITTPDGTTVLLVAGRTATIQLTADLIGRRLRCRGFGRSPGGVALSNLAITTGSVLPADAPPAGRCEATRTDLPLTVEAPRSAAPGARIMIAATLETPAAQARAAVLFVKRSAQGAGTLRRLQSLPAGAARARLRLSYRVPRSLRPGQRATFQVVLATFATRAAAARATSLRAACDAGDGRFALRIDG
jgi:trypsin